MFFNLGDISLFYLKKGSGNPLVLLHGNGEDHHTFDHAIDTLSAHYTVYAIDSRNHGQSTMTDQFHYQTMADDIKKFIKILALEHVTLVGFSDGGIIGLLLAIDQPIWLDRLIIMGANLYPKGVKPKVNDETEIAYQKTGNPYLKMMLEEPMITSKMLHQIDVPTTVVAGSNDVIMRRHTEKIARHIRHSKLLILEGETHESYVVRGNHLVHIIMS